MKRSPILRKTAMTRTAFARTPILKSTPARKSAMKSRASKMTPIRKSAKGEQCTLRFGVCNFDPATTVWAHSNRAEDGKGMGIKARDEEGCFSCSACHTFLDGGYANAGWDRLALDSYFNRARTLSQAILRQKGLMP